MLLANISTLKKDSSYAELMTVLNVFTTIDFYALELPFDINQMRKCSVHLYLVRRNLLKMKALNLSIDKLLLCISETRENGKILYGNTETFQKNIEAMCSHKAKLVYWIDRNVSLSTKGITPILEHLNEHID
jgi:hypothetical protein